MEISQESMKLHRALADKPSLVSVGLINFYFIGKYMSVNMMGNVTGRSEAIGPQEQFECVFEEDKVALETYNGCFLSVTEDGHLSATKKIVSEKEAFHIRTSVPKV